MARRAVLTDVDVEWGVLVGFGGHVLSRSRRRWGETDGGRAQP